jgi:hypothetical protein
LSSAGGPRQARFTVTSVNLGGLSFTADVAADDARGEGRLEAALDEVFRASDSAFCPGSLTIAGAGALFVQPRLLKELRRSWYALVEKKADEFVASVPGAVLAAGRALAGENPQIARAPARLGLSPLQGVNKLTGFITEWESLTAAQLASTPWGLALPLAPFTPNEESYFARLRDFLVRSKDEGGPRFFLGLSNPCHLTWLGRLRADGIALESWFVDWGFHSANPWTPAQLALAQPGLAFAVHWLEDPEAPDRSYFPPLFTSRACMLRNSFGAPLPSVTPTPGDQAFDSREWIQARLAGRAAVRPAEGPRCPAGCAGHFSARLVQGKRSFRVEARDCINYLIEE